MNNTHLLHHVLLLLIVLLLLPVPPSSSAVIPLGSTLQASNQDKSWSSPTSVFSLSFVQVEPSTSPPTYLAAITYAGGAGGVRIWSAGAVDSGGSLQLLPTGSLRLVNGSGSTVWDSKTENLGVSSAELDESGKLALFNNKSDPVWSSFENPTDVIVPNQNFTLNNTLTSGIYSFSLLKNGNLTLNWNGSNGIVYWSQGVNSSVDSSKFSNPSLGLQPTGILSLSDSSLSNPIIVAYSSDYGESGDVLRFVRLDEDGNLRVYTSPRNQGPLKKGWAAISDQCLVYGYCGELGICTYNDTSPICECPSQNFDQIDPKNSRKGCKRKVELANCASNNTQMVDMANTMFLTYGSELNQQLSYQGISACRSNCLQSPSCIASTSLSDGSGQCTQKISGFVNGYKNPSILLSTSYVKVCGKPVSNPTPLGVTETSKYWRLPAWIVVVVVVVTVLGLTAVEGGLWWWCCRHSGKFGGLSAQYALLEYASGAPVQFSYKELQRSTKGFKEKLGEGGFGAVYRGILANKTVVAVKQLEGIEQGEKQFRMEVATISSTHHLNLVRLIGFCSEGRHRLLVYEFMKNGSLDSFLFTTSEAAKSLTWEMRFNVALGTARGITYLHEECRDCIVHCDIKPENILLDENHNAKVSDFGLAKLINPKDHRYRTLTSVRGTRGYLAPEWLANLPITSKSDIYSFGMVLLEIVSGRRNFEVSDDTNRKKFSAWAYEELEKDNVWGIVDKRLVDQNVDMEQVKRAIQVSFWCIQEQPSQRPTMGKVVQMLEGITGIENPPAPKPLIEGSVSGTSINMSSSITSPVSTFAASNPAPSSTSSLQTSGFSASNIERVSSSLLRSEV